MLNTKEVEIPDEFKPILTLTPAEYEIFCLFGKGMSCKEVAAYPKHPRSVKTVWSFVAFLKRKLEKKAQSYVIVLAARWLFYLETNNFKRIPITEKVVLPSFRLVQES